MSRRWPAAAARVIYTEAPISLGRVVAIEPDGSVVVEVGGQSRPAAIDPSVDPTLLRDAIESGARVVLEPGHPSLIVGLLATHRTLTIDRNGDLSSRLRNLKIEVEGSLLLKATQSFLQMDPEGSVELFGQRLLTRARKVAKILAAHISLN